MVAGGGSIEMEMAKAVREYAAQVGGREQLAIEAFADALEVIPRTLAENAGLDILDTMVAMKTAHAKNEKYMGVNVFAGGVIDMLSEGVVEPKIVKEQAIKSGIEVASMILRIDDVLAARSGGMGGGAGGPPGGMPDDMDM
jgi:chaperonin GroEL (HSP60 family)